LKRKQMKGTRKRIIEEGEEENEKEKIQEQKIE
jgi:hypothetical protein